jgi:3-oxoacyl-[acyl-carrier-protein] synthase-1
MKHKIYLSKPAVISCAGNSIETLYSSVVNADRSGIVPVTIYEKTYFTGYVNTAMLPPVSTCADTRIMRITDAASEQIRDIVHYVTKQFGKDRIAVCIGSCDNGSELSLQAHKEYFKNGKFPDSYEIHFQGASVPAEYIAKKFDISGPVVAYSAACASSADAIIKAAELIAAGFCDAAIAGGVDIASNTALLGFDSLGAIAKTYCNPFDKNRDGINLGEGGCFFVMSKKPFPDNKKIYLEGYGSSADAHHMTAPAPDGSGASRAMKAALDSAGLNADDIDYINLHGTGTVHNDSAEAYAVASIFSGSGHTLVSSTKTVTGHTLGAAGALEAAICWYTLYSGVHYIPPRCSDGIEDESIPRLRFSEKGSVIDTIKHCMSNSLAFGGCNISLILGVEYD